MHRRDRGLSAGWYCAGLLFSLFAVPARAQFEEISPTEINKQHAKTAVQILPEGKIVESGDGYQVLESSASGVAKYTDVEWDTEDTPVSPSASGVYRTYVFHTLGGIQRANLPPALKSDLMAEYGRAGVAPDSIDVGTLLIDEHAAELAFEDVGSDPEPTFPSDPRKVSPLQSAGAATKLSICGKKRKPGQKTKSIRLGPGRSQRPLDVGGFSGSLDFNSNLAGEIAITAHYVKKTRCGIPYGIEVERVAVRGDVDMTGSELTYSGTVFQIPERRLVDFDLLDVEGSLSFWVGPFLLIITAGVEAEAGIDVSAEVRATVGLRTPVTGRYSFLYNCTKSGCLETRPSENTLQFGSQAVQFLGAVDARATLKPWLQVNADVSGSLYTRRLRFAKAGVGANVAVPAMLWGYYGNVCGDASGDGLNETVSAAVLDVAADVYMYADASVLGWKREWAIDLGLGSPWEKRAYDSGRMTEREKHTYRRGIYYRDFIGSGSSALSPIILASSSSSPSASYTFQARPCVPFLANQVDYAIDWGADGMQTVRGAKGGVTVAHEWNSSGRQQINAYLASDSQGRELNGPVTTRFVEIAQRQLPSVPATISVPASAVRQVSVSWSASTGSPSRYEAQLSRAGGNWEGTQTTSSTSLEFANLTTGTYRFRVRACNNSGCSDYRTSNEVAVLQCNSNAQCDDGMFCNGLELCGANNQCTPGRAPCGTLRWCSEEQDTCERFDECGGARGQYCQ